MEQMYHAPSACACSHADRWEFRKYGKDVHIYAYCRILRPEMISIGDYVRIDDRCRLEGGLGVTLGDNVHIGSGSCLNTGGGELVFGAHSGCSVNVVIATGHPDLSYLHISAAEPPDLCHVIKKRTVIGEYVVIYPGAYISPGVVIGDGAIIWPGAVVTKNVPPFEEWAGNPARYMRRREVQIGLTPRPHLPIEDWRDEEWAHQI